MTRRRLDAELVRRHLVASRAEAQRAIEAGLVEVAGVVVPKAATMVAPADPVHLVAPTHPYVGRGGLKLAAALDHFEIDPQGRTCLDVGASTGGFTDCLLQRQAASVVALDVGHNQLDWRLRNDSRVRVMERTNIRHADPEEVGAPFDLVVCDVSFIGLAVVAPHLVAMGGPGTDHVVLVKPQFEVGKDEVGAKGVVRDQRLHAAAIRSVVDAFGASDVAACDVMASPITGTKGNREFLLHLREDCAGLKDSTIAAVVAA